MTNMTIYDIAKEAGVSISTVSRVLNHKAGIKPATREKVQQVLDKYNYQPSPAAKGLADKSSQTVALITQDIRDTHFSSTVYTVEQELKKRGYSCYLINTGKTQAERLACLETAMHKQVEGVILIGSTYEEKYMQRGIARYLSETPVVMANGYLPLPNVCGIICDGKLGIAEAVAHLAAKGHERIAYIGGVHTASARAKLVGYQEEMAKLGLPALIVDSKGNGEMDGGEIYTRECLETFPGITAIVYERDIMAVGGYHVAEDLGLAIPEDISIIGFDNSEYAQVLRPELTSVDDKIGIMGTKCVQSLFEMFDNGTTVGQMMLIPELIIRESTRKI